MCSLRYFLEDNVYTMGILLLFFLGGGGIAKISNIFGICLIFQIFFLFTVDARS